MCRCTLGKEFLQWIELGIATLFSLLSTLIKTLLKTGHQLQTNQFCQFSYYDSDITKKVIDVHRGVGAGGAGGRLPPPTFLGGGGA